MYSMLINSCSAICHSPIYLNEHNMKQLLADLSSKAYEASSWAARSSNKQIIDLDRQNSWKLKGMRERKTKRPLSRWHQISSSYFYSSHLSNCIARHSAEITGRFKIFQFRFNTLRFSSSDSSDSHQDLRNSREHSANICFVRAHVYARHPGLWAHAAAKLSSMQFKFD